MLAYMLSIFKQTCELYCFRITQYLLIFSSQFLTSNFCFFSYSQQPGESAIVNDSEYLSLSAQSA